MSSSRIENLIAWLAASVLVTLGIIYVLKPKQEADPATEFTVDLVGRELRAGETVRSFEIDDYTRWRLLEGLDDIAITLGHEDEIAEYEANRPAWKPATLPSRTSR